MRWEWFHSEFGWTGWNPPGIHPEFGWIGIQVDPSESGGNGGNLVGIWWEWFPVQVKFGWVSTDMIFLPNSYHSYHSTWIPPGSGWNVRGRVKYSPISMVPGQGDLLSWNPSRSEDWTTGKRCSLKGLSGEWWRGGQQYENSGVGDRRRLGSPWRWRWRRRWR